MQKVFVSYSHAQTAWVTDRLIPVLRAGGTEPLFDERFGLGRIVIGEMDDLQDKAEKHILCLSDEYLASPFCRHEMDRALARDPTGTGTVLPLRLSGVVPDPLETRLFADLTNDTKPEPWKKLMEACNADLGICPVRWLDARDKVLKSVADRRSINLLLRRSGLKWEPLLDDVAKRHSGMAVVDLQEGATVSRDGLLNRVLNGLGARERVRQPPHDLEDFQRIIEATTPSPHLVAIKHFDLVSSRTAYGVDLFAALRWMIMDRRVLILLAVSRTAFAALLPVGHPLSEIDLTTVELA